MKLKLASAVIALVLCSQRTPTACVKSSVTLFVAKDHARMTEMGRFFCAAVFGTAVQDGQGEVVCGLGRTRHPSPGK